MHRAYQQGMALCKCSKIQLFSLDTNVGMTTGVTVTNQLKHKTGPAELVRLFRFWPDQFFSRLD